MEAMLGAFRLNLQALSLLSLLVGVFLVYNTAMFAVVSRRHDAGVLRSLGAGRGEIAAAFCAEILLLGAAGGALGGALGYLLARLLTGTVGGTISTLYFFLRPSPPDWSWWIPAAGAALGCVAGLLGALVPLVALARSVPVQLLGRRAPGRGERRTARAAAIAGCALAAASLGLLALPGSGVVAGIAGSFGVLLGVVLATGEALALLGPAIEALLTRLGGLPGKIASGFIRRSLGRTAVATAAFTVALSMSIGLGTLIGSFRHSLDRWMEAQINADLYVGKAVEGSVPEEVAEGLRALPGRRGAGPLPLRRDPPPRAAGPHPGGGRRRAPALRPLPVVAGRGRALGGGAARGGGRHRELLAALRRPGRASGSSSRGAPARASSSSRRSSSTTRPSTA